MAEIELNVIRSAIEVVRLRQDHPPPTEFQIKVVERLVNQKNSVNQLPTGSGKTWPVISLPSILRVLRENFKQEVAQECRVLYIVPLVSIYHSLSREMKSLNIPHQILSSGSESRIDIGADIVCVSPEKLLEKSVMNSIVKLSWLAVSIDEPHLALMWGLSKSKFSKPFREAFAKLNSLNSLGVCFELHSATLQNLDSIFRFLGRKDSIWSRQLELPERNNLTYFLFSGNHAPHNILQLPSVKRAIHDDNESGITLVYVQRISDGAELQLSLLEYCDSNGMLEANNVKPVAFLHSNLTDGKKEEILQNAVDLRIRILIATSAVGAGINIPVVQFIGWGLDGDTTGVVQAQGRTARNPLRCEGIVIWVHNAKVHGRRVPLHSKVRDLINTECLRVKMNSWFDHKAATLEVSKPEPEFCCCMCMRRCIEENDCQTCLIKMNTYKPETGVDEKNFVKKLTLFLSSLDINSRCPDSTPVNKENSIAQEVVNHLKFSHQGKQGLAEFLEIFSLGQELNQEILSFLNDESNEVPSQNLQTPSEENLSNEYTGDSESSDSDVAAGVSEEEYYDSEDN